MWPQIFELDSHGLHLGLSTYGVLAAIGFSVALWLMARGAWRQGLPQRDVVDMGFWLLVAGLGGARIFFVAQHFQDYTQECFGPTGRSLWRAVVECTRVLQVWEGGLVYYGGLIAAVPFAVWLARRRGIGFLRFADLTAPSLSIGHFFGRLGCFSAGCCWGKVCDLPFGARFPADSFPFSDLARSRRLSFAALETPPLHPTQLYEAAGELAIFFALTRFAVRKRFEGQVVLLYVAAYAALRFIVEVFRGDAGRGYVLRFETPGLNRLLGFHEWASSFLSTAQLISLLSVVVVAGLWPRLRRGGVVHVPTAQPSSAASPHPLAPERNPPP